MEKGSSERFGLFEHQQNPRDEEESEGISQMGENRRRVFYTSIN